MYSYEERLKAVKLYIQYDKSYASVFRELGYPPSNRTLKRWFKEYEQNGDVHKSYIKTSIYTDEQRKAAIQYYIEHPLLQGDSGTADKGQIGTISGIMDLITGLR